MWIVWGWDDVDLGSRLRIRGIGQYNDLSMVATHQWHPQRICSQVRNEAYFKAKGFDGCEAGDHPNLVANQGREWGSVDPAMTSILVCVPTVPGRQVFLANCARSYERGTYNPFNLSIVYDARSAGEGWQRCVEQGLEWWPETTHVHFANDDICVARGWDAPLVEACDRRMLPAMRVEPAGGHIVEQLFDTHPVMPPDYPLGMVPRDKVAYFFAGKPEEQPTQDWERVYHGNLPFCSVEQWREFGPYPPIHYGTDRWISEIARDAGVETVARLDSVAFNYNANIGRHRGTWEEQDFAAFDGIFALPAYLAGILSPYEPHPLRETVEGLAMVRDWRAAHEGRNPNVDWRLMNDEGRFEILARGAGPVTHIHLLCTLADMMDRPAYLEIGVGDANCFKFVSERCRVAHAVDVRSNPYGNVKKTAMTYPCASFWEDGSDKFFELYAGEPFNLIFIDGSHWAEQVRRDWKNSLSVLAPNGFIALHDTWSPSGRPGGDGI